MWMQFYRDPITALDREYNRRGPIFAFGNIRRRAKSDRLFVVAIGEQFNRQVLSDTDVFRSRGLVLPGPLGSAHQVLRHGLISMNGQQHRRHRSLVMPPFRKHAMASYRDAIVRHTEQMLDAWRPVQTRDIYADMHGLALRIAADVLFGCDDSQKTYETAKMMSDWLSMCFRPSVWLMQFNLPGTSYGRLLKHAGCVRNQVKEMIHLRRQRGAEGGDVLSILLKNNGSEGAGLTEDELIGQTNIMFLAAHETTASALTWTLFLLSQHPQVLAELTDEVTGVLHGGPPTIEDFDRLPLMQRVIKESLRILPPVVFGTRIADQPVEVGPYRLTKGSRVLFSQYMTHRLPELYPRPRRFDPDRWLESNPSPYAYFPFGAGSRMCIGYEFSMMLLRICLAMIVQRFRLSLTQGARIDRKFAVTLSPKHGIPMTVHRQDGQFTQVLPAGNIHEMVDLNHAAPRLRVIGMERNAPSAPDVSGSSLRSIPDTRSREAA
jgi:cytochrome P450